ncbi:hypothetical protein HNP46_001633 [Pseudomonas nitritireducens]|uniref:Outer membrane lipoprotein-sorting protein n=1 Tax=Pseudomonas nitroreducens TaxID=46680 RepID=A0A7W7P0L8_PSENT|nr:hypothetical protein [Pseudomonas nitritireducens]MBB4862789.1 hypothetical protein [Pseudomonas nitritireducens]
MPNLFRLIRPLLALPLLGIMQASHAGLDESLASAIDGLWQDGRAPFSVLGSSLVEKSTKDSSDFQAEVKNSPVYRVSGAEAAAVLVGNQRFDALTTPWGSFPRLQVANTRLLALDLPKRHYQVLAGPGEGLFAVGDWQRYEFLHVLDLSTPGAPRHHALYSDAYLGERVLGQLPGSSVLNYARLVPAGRDRQGRIDAYEVTLYALGRKGAEPVLEGGHKLAYALQREGDGWSLSHLQRTPETDTRDEEGRWFMAAPRPALFVRIPPKDGDERP